MTQLIDSSAPMVRAMSLTKKFRGLSAVDNISFDVHRGETFGMLGPNGAGKTSTMRMLTSMSPITSGELLVDGMNVARRSREVRQILGVVAQQDGLDPDLNVRDNLVVHASFFGLGRRQARDRADEVLAFFALSHRAGDQVDKLSGGMRRRLTIARAFMSQPRVVVLDEPTTGLDPQSRTSVWEQLAVLKASGVTVIMSTHYMEEAATLCDRLVIMDHGRILAQGTPDDLVRSHAGPEVAQVRPNGRPRAAVAEELRRSGFRYRELGALFDVSGTNGEKPELSAIGGVRITYRRSTLEDVFLNLTGRDLRDD